MTIRILRGNFDESAIDNPTYSKKWWWFHGLETADIKGVCLDCAQGATTGQEVAHNVIRPGEYVLSQDKRYKEIG